MRCSFVGFGEPLVEGDSAPFYIDIIGPDWFVAMVIERLCLVGIS